MVGELETRRQSSSLPPITKAKRARLAELFGPIGIETVSAGALGLPEPEETGETFAENAKIKAGAVTSVTGMISVADDSGLEVAALGGAPGIHSARWGGPNKDFGLAMERVNRELEVSGSADRSAKFVCALALGQPRGETLVRIGKINGTIVWPPRGTRGFGYDPIFVPEGYTETFGEMDPVEKKRHLPPHASLRETDPVDLALR